MVNPRHQAAQGQSVAKFEHPCTLVEYPSRYYKHGIKESEGNIFNSIFKGNFQGRNHPGRCAFEELDLFTFMKPKRVMQNKNNNGNKIPIEVATVIIILNSIKE